jgi:hypothetical protein
MNRIGADILGPAPPILVESQVCYKESPSEMTDEEHAAMARQQLRVAAASRVVYSIRDISVDDIVRQMRYANRWDFHKPSRRNMGLRAIVRGAAGCRVDHCEDA